MRSARHGLSRRWSGGSSGDRKDTIMTQQRNDEFRGQGFGSQGPQMGSGDLYGSQQTGQFGGQSGGQSGGQMAGRQDQHSQFSEPGRTQYGGGQSSPGGQFGGQFGGQSGAGQYGGQYGGQFGGSSEYGSMSQGANPGRFQGGPHGGYPGA